MINGISLSKSLGGAQNTETLKRAVLEGHDIGDHSLNHMKHNNRDTDASNAYKDVKTDSG